MKVQHLFLMFAVTAMCLTACNEPQVMPGDNDNNQKALVIPDPTPDPEGFNVPEGAINVYKAVEIAKGLKFGETSDKRYLIKGYLTSFNRDDKFQKDFPTYGNDYFYISAVQPSDEQPIHNFYAYRALGKFGAKLPDLECLKEGDFVVLSCYITNYNGVFESGGACFVLASNNEHFNATFPNNYAAPKLKSGEVSVSEAEAEIMKLASKEKTSKYFDVRGYICSIDTTGRSLASVTFNITDGTTFATAFTTYYKEDQQIPFTSFDQVLVGDEVVVHAILQNFNGTCEPVYGYIKESNNPNF